jgi:hypothetical protein
MKPKLKAPKTKRLILNCDELLSSVSFKFNLRRYCSDEREHRYTMCDLEHSNTHDELWNACQAGAYTRSRFRST